MTRAVTPATLRGLRLLVLDVDGVLTDGGLYYTESGEELKRFDVRDGQGIVLLHAAGVRTALVTARWSTVVERRAREAGAPGLNDVPDILLPGLFQQRRMDPPREFGPQPP